VRESRMVSVMCDGSLTLCHFQSIFRELQVCLRWQLCTLVWDDVMFFVVFSVSFMLEKGREIVILLEFQREQMPFNRQIQTSQWTCYVTASSQLLKLLSPYRAVYQDGPIVMSAPDSSSAAGSPESKNQVPSPTTPLMRKKKKFPEAGNVTTLMYSLQSDQYVCCITNCNYLVDTHTHTHTHTHTLDFLYPFVSCYSKMFNRVTALLS